MDKSDFPIILKQQQSFIMKYLLIIISFAFCIGANAQGGYTPDATKKRFSQGLIAFGAGDTANFKNAVDTNLLVYQRSNGKLYFRGANTSPYYEVPTIAGLSGYLQYSDTSLMLDPYMHKDFSNVTGSLLDANISSSSNWNTAYTDRLKWDGGATGLTASTGRTSLGGTTVGQNLFTLTDPSAITFLRINADNTVTALDAASFRTAIGAGTSSTTGTVTSVAMTVPTGLTVSGTPITSSGTLSVSLQSGYSIPTTTSQTNWDAAYNDKINSITFSASTLTLTQQDGGTVTQSVPTFNQNTTGNAATATNAVQWGGYELIGGAASSPTHSFLYSSSDSKYHPATLSEFQSWIGLGSNAYTSTEYLPLSAGASYPLTGNLIPGSNASYDLGSSSLRWATLYSYHGNFNGDVSVGGTTTVTSYLTANWFKRSGTGSGWLLEQTGYTNRGLYWDQSELSWHFYEDGSARVKLGVNGSVTGAGTFTASSFSGAGTGLTGLASNLTAGYIHNRYWATDANNIWQSGVYTFYNGTNVPGGDFGMLSIPVFSGVDASNKYNLQIGAGISGDPKYRITDIYGAGTWYSILTAYNYNSYSPTLTGTGASGTWSINISGTAGNATTWNSQTYNPSASSSIYNYILAYNVDGTWRPTTAAATQTWLGLGTSAYLGISLDSELGYYFPSSGAGAYGYLKTAAFWDANQDLLTSSNVTFNQVTATILGSVGTSMGSGGILSGTQVVLRLNIGGTYYYFSAYPTYSPPQP